MQNKKPNIINLATSIFAIVVTAMSLSATSAALISGPGFIDLPSPGKTGAPISVNPIFTDTPTSYTGEWDGTAALDWQGKIIGTGQRILTTPNKTGTENMDFSGLTNGYLPKNSFFGLFDLDRGSQSGEIISLRAWDASGDLIKSAWLDVPTFQDGTPLNHTADMLPDFNWNPITGIYTFDGNGETWSSNPSISVWMQNNEEILKLEVNDQTPFASFALSAPPLTAVPEPATIFLFGSGLMALSGLRKRKHIFRKKG